MVKRKDHDRIPFIDGIRALAALLVAYDHALRMSWPRVPGTPPQEPDGGWLLAFGWARYGHFAVTVFILISGFCLILPFIDRPLDPRRFLISRSLRILPTYYAALALSLLLIATLIGAPTGTQWDASLPVTAHGIVSKLIMLQDLWLPDQINPPFWSIAVEWRIYFLFPLFLPLVLSSRRLLYTAAIAILCYLPFFLPDAVHSHTLADRALYAAEVLGAVVHYASVFMLGMLSAFLYCRPQSSRLCALIAMHAGKLAALFLGLFAAAVGVWNFAAVEAHINAFDILLSIGALFAILFLARSERHPVRRVLEWQPLVWIGGISYSVYLMHFPLEQVFWQYGLAPLHLSKPVVFLMFLGPGMAFILAACWLFYLAAEKPALIARRRLLRHYDHSFGTPRPQIEELPA